jgi:hypothetical protein
LEVRRLPTYRNDTDRRITHCDMGYMEWRPGEEKRLSFFVPHEKLGLTVASPDPPVNRETSVAADWTVSLDPGDPARLDLPYFEAFELSVFSLGGTAYMTVGDGEVEVTVSEDESHFSSYSYARCPYLTFGCDAAATVRVKQEERNTRNTLRRGA